MQIILLERVEKLGSIGDVVTVKDGYARNLPAAEQEGAARQRCQPQGIRSQPRTDRSPITPNAAPKPNSAADRSMA